MKNYIIVYLALMVWICTCCNEFLEKKPDIKMAIPKTLADADLLLNDYATLNNSYPSYGEVGTDDYYLTKPLWEGLSSVDFRNTYIWADEPYTDVIQWQRPYKTVYIANQVMDILSYIGQSRDTPEYKRIIGAAYFYRAFALHLLTELHCSAYDENTADLALGMPIRLSSGVDEQSIRSSLKITYQQIIKDFKEAVDHLPFQEAVKGRPFKASAYAGLARVYLDMGDYERAYLYADSCLQIRSDLIDFNTLKNTDTYPVPKFNIEVLFPATATNAAPLNATTALMDTLLMQSYHENDLRKGIFFKANNNPVGSYYFKGSYDKSNTLFYGISNSEVYLIKAETACRTGKLDIARETVNKLLKSRWNKDVVYPLINETSAQRLLEIILNERRKELVFRGRRWSDLKRLNLDARFQKTLTRKIGNQVYTLAPNSPKYAYRLSEMVIKLANIQQNPR